MIYTPGAVTSLDQTVLQLDQNSRLQCSFDCEFETLYGISGSNRWYTLNLETGIATRIAYNVPGDPPDKVNDLGGAACIKASPLAAISVTTDPATHVGVADTATLNGDYSGFTAGHDLRYYYIWGCVSSSSRWVLAGGGDGETDSYCDSFTNENTLKALQYLPDRVRRHGRHRHPEGPCQRDARWYHRGEPVHLHRLLLSSTSAPTVTCSIYMSTPVLTRLFLIHLCTHRHASST